MCTSVKEIRFGIAHIALGMQNHGRDRPERGTALDALGRLPRQRLNVLIQCDEIVHEPCLSLVSQGRKMALTGLELSDTMLDDLAELQKL